ATAITKENRRKVLGFKIDHEESYEAWKDFLTDLKDRGVQAPKLIISDAHEGLKKAVSRVFVRSSWQRRAVHFKRNLMDKLPKKGTSQIRNGIKQIFNAISPVEARESKDHFINKHMDNHKFVKVIDRLED